MMIMKQFAHFFAHFAVLHLGFCNANLLIGEIVEAARENEFPFFVTISSSSDFTKSESHFCGGTLISEKHVLTTAQCWEPNLSMISRFIKGEKSVNKTAFKVQSWTDYSHWAGRDQAVSNEFDNNIAIITLSQKVEGVAPATISKLKYDEIIGKRVVAVTWDREIYPDTLTKTYMDILNLEQHKKNATKIGSSVFKPHAFPNFYYTDALELLHINYGDSGSPLLLASNNELIGLNHAFCKVRTAPKYTLCHVNLDFYRKFIEDALEEKN